MSLSLMGVLIGPGMVSRGLLVSGAEAESPSVTPTNLQLLTPGPDVRIRPSKQPTVRLRTKKRS